MNGPWRESTATRPPGGFPGSPNLKGTVSVSGERWDDVRRRLRPRYIVAWRDITLCYAMVAGGLGLLTGIAAAWGPRAAFVVVPFIACWGGFWLHALWLFGHEAAHGNLAPSRALNDALADAIVWPLFAETTGRFRARHWKHHRHHGAAGDTETTYHQCLSQGFLVRSLTGVLLLKGLFRARSDSTTRGRGAALRAFALHAVVLGLLWLSGPVALPAAWLGSVLVFFPAFAAVRQILEHRSTEVGCDVDFAAVDHGPVNRMFPAGPMSRYYGAAGFNRHLLHHWAPEISYTRFDDLEAFLLRTPLARDVEQSRTTYVDAFLQMLRASSPPRATVRSPRRPALRRVEIRP